MNHISNIRLLSTEFYKAYTHDKYPELLKKENRPYLILIIELDGIQFGIPFRTNIKHRFAYKFINSNKVTETITGLDFSKAVVIEDPKYLGERAFVDFNENRDVLSHYKEIKEKFIKYVYNVKKYINGEIRDEYFAKRLSTSTLLYFKDSLVSTRH